MDNVVFVRALGGVGQVNKDENLKLLGISKQLKHTCTTSQIQAFVSNQTQCQSRTMALYVKIVVQLV